MVAKRCWCWLIGLGLVLSLPLGPARGERPDAARTIAAIQIQLKVQSITKESFFMGEVWVAPPSFTDVQIGKQYVGYARAAGLDAAGNRIDLSPKWQVSDPAMVEVAPNPGHKVKLTVLKTGESYLTATAGPVSQQLVIKADYRDGAMHVAISQEQLKRTKGGAVRSR